MRKLYSSLIVFLVLLFSSSSVFAASYQGFEIKKGDIFITDGTSLWGLTGHAAIANGSNYILDAPGYNFSNPSPQKLPTTTRQKTVASWLDEYTGKGTVWVYRLPSAYQNIASAAGDWADRNYFSSTGGSVQNIFPEYGVNWNTKQKDPTHCSKIVWQAYYFGSGDAEVFVPTYYTVLSPYGLIDNFLSPYKPVKVKTFY